MRLSEVEVSGEKITITKSDLQAELDRIIDKMEECKMLDDVIQWMGLYGMAEIIKDLLGQFKD